MTTRNLGGNRDTLGKHGYLGGFGRLGNVHARDGGFSDSPLAGSLIEENIDDLTTIVAASSPIPVNVAATPAAAAVVVDFSGYSVGGGDSGGAGSGDGGGGASGDGGVGAGGASASGDGGEGGGTAGPGSGDGGAGDGGGDGGPGGGGDGGSGSGDGGGPSGGGAAW